MTSNNRLLVRLRSKLGILLPQIPRALTGDLVHLVPLPGYDPYGDSSDVPFDNGERIKYIIEKAGGEAKGEFPDEAKFVFDVDTINKARELYRGFLTTFGSGKWDWYGTPFTYLPDYTTYEDIVDAQTDTSYRFLYKAWTVKTSINISNTYAQSPSQGWATSTTVYEWRNSIRNLDYVPLPIIGTSVRAVTPNRTSLLLPPAIRGRISGYVVESNSWNNEIERGATVIDFNPPEGQPTAYLRVRMGEFVENLEQTGKKIVRIRRTWPFHLSTEGLTFGGSNATLLRIGDLTNSTPILGLRFLGGFIEVEVSAFPTFSNDEVMLVSEIEVSSAELDGYCTSEVYLYPNSAVVSPEEPNPDWVMDAISVQYLYAFNIGETYVHVNDTDPTYPNRFVSPWLFKASIVGADKDCNVGNNQNASVYEAVLTASLVVSSGILDPMTRDFGVIESPTYATPYPEKIDMEDQPLHEMLTWVDDFLSEKLFPYGLMTALVLDDGARVGVDCLQVLIDGAVTEDAIIDRHRWTLYSGEPMFHHQSSLMQPYSVKEALPFAETIPSRTSLNKYHVAWNRPVPSNSRVYATQYVPYLQYGSSADIDVSPQEVAYFRNTFVFRNVLVGKSLWHGPVRLDCDEGSSWTTQGGYVDLPNPMFGGNIEEATVDYASVQAGKSGPFLGIGTDCGIFREGAEAEVSLTPAAFLLYQGLTQYWFRNEYVLTGPWSLRNKTYEMPPDPVLVLNAKTAWTAVDTGGGVLGWSLTQSPTTESYSGSSHVEFDLYWDISRFYDEDYNARVKALFEDSIAASGIFELGTQSRGVFVWLRNGFNIEEGATFDASVTLTLTTPYSTASKTVSGVIGFTVGARDLVNMDSSSIRIKMNVVEELPDMLQVLRDATDLTRLDRASLGKLKVRVAASISPNSVPGTHAEPAYAPTVLGQIVVYNDWFIMGGMSSATSDDSSVFGYDVTIRPLPVGSTLVKILPQTYYIDEEDFTPDQRANRLYNVESPSEIYITDTSSLSKSYLGNTFPAYVRSGNVRSHKIPSNIGTVVDAEYNSVYGQFLQIGPTSRMRGPKDGSPASPLLPSSMLPSAAGVSVQTVFVHEDPVPLFNSGIEVDYIAHTNPDVADIECGVSYGGTYTPKKAGWDWLVFMDATHAVPKIYYVLVVDRIIYAEAEDRIATISGAALVDTFVRFNTDSGVPVERLLTHFYKGPFGGAASAYKAATWNTYSGLEIQEDYDRYYTPTKQWSYELNLVSVSASAYPSTKILAVSLQEALLDRDPVIRLGYLVEDTAVFIRGSELRWVPSEDRKTWSLDLSGTTFGIPNDVDTVIAVSDPTITETVFLKGPHLIPPNAAEAALPGAPKQGVTPAIVQGYQGVVLQ